MELIVSSAIPGTALHSSSAFIIFTATSFHSRFARNLSLFVLFVHLHSLLRNNDIIVNMGVVATRYHCRNSCGSMSQ